MWCRMMLMIIVIRVMFNMIRLECSGFLFMLYRKLRFRFIFFFLFRVLLKWYVWGVFFGLNRDGGICFC